MKCDLCGTNVKVVGHTTKQYEPVVDREMILKIIDSIISDQPCHCASPSDIFYEKKAVADAIISAMYGDKK